MMYEMAYGVLPFNSDDDRDLLRCTHMAMMMVVMVMIMVTM
jgi:hypothetical protein